MPNELHSLTINEVSLVDNPSNSTIDPITGRKIPRARVAFFKRDGDPRTNQQKEQYMFERILKSDTTTRDQITTAVTKRATEIATERGCSVAAAEHQVWSEHPELVTKYESAPLPVNPMQASSQMARLTPSEIAMDDLTRKIMKSDNLNYQKAFSKVMDLRPDLYLRYCKEAAEGDFTMLPEPRKADVSAAYFQKRAMEADEDGV